MDKRQFDEIRGAMDLLDQDLDCIEKQLQCANCMKQSDIKQEKPPCILQDFDEAKCLFRL